MPAEIRLWDVIADGTLQERHRERLDIEERLEGWLVHDISMLDPELLVIGRQVETDFGGRIDLLCIDETGNLTVVELKRDRTPREVTAQVLDYASWVDGLSGEMVTAIGDRYLGQEGALEARFRERFGSELPETVNQEHRLLVVGSEIDSSSERIIRYLSEKHGIDINAVTFNYFKDPDGRELVGRAFLVEPQQVEYQKRTRGGSKRRRDRTLEELEAIADENGAGELYRYGTALFEQVLALRTRGSLLQFTAQIGKKGNRIRPVMSFAPGDSSAQDGLRFHFYTRRFAEAVGLNQDDVPNLLPSDAEPWKENPDAGPFVSGFAGYFRRKEDLDRVRKGMGGPRQAPPRSE